jgi:hypothetical protein
MRGIGLLAAGAASLVACELVTGIHDKTLASDPSLPCSQEPQPFLLCDDFDVFPEAGHEWQWDTPEGGATVNLDPNDFKTPPNSVQVYAPLTSPQAQLGKPVGNIAQSFRLAFDLRVDVADLTGIPEMAVVQILTDGNQTSINYVLGKGAFCSLFAYDTGKSGWSFTQRVDCPPLGTWTRIVIAYDANQGVTLIEDGRTLYTEIQDATAAAVARGAPGQTDLIIGNVYLNPPGTTPVTVEIDDVILRGQ